MQQQEPSTSSGHRLGADTPSASSDTKTKQRCQEMGWPGNGKARCQRSRDQTGQHGQAASLVVSSAQPAVLSQAAAASAAAALPRVRTASLQHSDGSAAAALLDKSSGDSGSARSTQSCDAFLK